MLSHHSSDIHCPEATLQRLLVASALPLGASAGDSLGVDHASLGLTEWSVLIGISGATFILSRLPPQSLRPCLPDVTDVHTLTN